jgi:hypothetical protein
MAKQSFNVICPTPTTLLQGVKKEEKWGLQRIYLNMRCMIIAERIMMNPDSSEATLLTFWPDQSCSKHVMANSTLSS